MNAYKRRTWIACLLAGSIVLGGCSQGGSDFSDASATSEYATTETAGTVSVSGNRSYETRDRDSLYPEESRTEVETMYLTVTRGNATESTDHTWSELNDYSVYDYEDMGVERYGVNGLLQVGDENGPVADELGYGRTTPNCTVTIRGQTSSRLAIKNYKITLKENGGTWRDQSIINLNKHVSEGLRFRNKLMYDLQSEIDELLSMRTTFVHLYVRDQTENPGEESFVDYGLYTQVEQPNKAYLRTHGLDREGHLYKENMIFEFYRYEESILLTTDPEYDEEKFRYYLKSRGSNDHTKLISMLEDVNNGSVGDAEVLDTWFDRDNLAMWMAFNIYMGNTDTQSRNTLLYSPLNENTWYFINWDCDTALIETESVLLERGDDKGWEYGVSNYWGNVLLRRALMDDEFRELLDEKMNYLREFITEEKLMSMVEEYGEVVDPFVYEGADSDNLPLTKEQRDTVISNLYQEMQDNYELYLDSLENPLPFYIGTPEMKNGSLRFSWDAAYDFQADDLRYELTLANNPEMNDPIFRESNLYLAEVDYTGTLEPGQYFLKVTAEDSDGNIQPAFDYYVTNNSIKHYGVICFYVAADGTITLEELEG